MGDWLKIEDWLAFFWMINGWIYNLTNGLIVDFNGDFGKYGNLIEWLINNWLIR